MSWKALAWAAKCHVKHSADKLVLLGLAERHNEESGTAYPSIDWLAEFGSLNRKTVIAALDRLEAAGLIADSGDRKGKTRQVKAYSLHVETVPKTEPSQKRNSTGFSVKQSQKRDTEPSREPVSSEAKASSDKPARKIDQFPCPDGVDAIDWSSLIANRKAKRAPMTPGAYRQIVKKLDQWSDAGWPPGPIVANAAELGWTTVFPTDEMKARQNGRRTLGRNQPPDDGLGPTARSAIAAFPDVFGPDAGHPAGTGH